jgi:glycosyltransferase involved in cell wall biosynthesis
MHVVFLNRSFYPDTSATSQILTDLCEDLVQIHGCRVTVICGASLLPETNGAPSGPSEAYRGIRIVRVRGSRFSKARFAGRATNYVTYFLSACWAALRIEKPDVVVALTDPPIIGLAGWLASRRHGAPLVMAYQDLFPEVATLLEDFHSQSINALLQAVNRFLCRKAARVVALGETMRARLIDNKGAAPERTVVIPSGADTLAIDPQPKRNPFSVAHGLADKFVVMHSGNLGLSQSLDTLIDAAVLLKDVDDLQIVFQGEGVKKAVLESRCRDLGLPNVMFLPFQPKAQLAESFGAADIFIVSLQAGLAGYIVPSKLYGILAAGRPYVAAVEAGCEVASITRANDCGLVAEPGSPRDLADKILAFYRDREMTLERGTRARAASLAFDRRVQCRRYFNLFQAVTGRAGAVPVPRAARPGTSRVEPTIPTIQ